MNITYIHQHFKLPSEGGGSRPYEFARRMAADGHIVTMICGGLKSLDTEVDGIRIKRLAVPYKNAMSIPERMWSFLRFMIEASITAARIKCDVIYASSTPLTVAVPGIVAKFVQRKPMVFEVRDLWPSVPIELGFLRNPAAIWMARLLEKAAYRNAVSVVALSPGMRDGVLRIAPTKNVAIIPNACDFELFDKSEEERKAFRASQGWLEDEIVVVYAGGFGPTYQLDWPIRLASAVHREGIRFLLIGEGQDSENLHKLAGDLGLDPQAVLLGGKSKAEVAKYISASDLVLSSLRDDPCLEVNSLNKVFDALAASRPVLLNHEGWLKDAVVGSEAGWQLSRSIEKAADQFLVIAKDDLALRTAERNSAALGKACFQRDDLYRKLISVLENAADQSS